MARRCRIGSLTAEESEVDRASIVVVGSLLMPSHLTGTEWTITPYHPPPSLACCCLPSNPQSSCCPTVNTLAAASSPGGTANTKCNLRACSEARDCVSKSPKYRCQGRQRQHSSVPIVVPITNLPASGEAESNLSTTPKLFYQPVRELCQHHHGPTSWVPGPAKPHCSGVARRSDLLTDGGAGQCRGVEGARSGCLVDRSAGCKTGAAATSKNVGGSMIPPP